MMGLPEVSTGDGDDETLGLEFIVMRYSLSRLDPTGVELVSSPTVVRLPDGTLCVARPFSGDFLFLFIVRFSEARLSQVEGDETLGLEFVVTRYSLRRLDPAGVGCATSTVSNICLSDEVESVGNSALGLFVFRAASLLLASREALPVQPRLVGTWNCVALLLFRKGLR